MKKLIQNFLIAGLITCNMTTFAQTWDSLAAPHATEKLLDIAAKGNVLFVTAGTGGVFKSNDMGATWTACAALPDNGFGDEGAGQILVASNGDLIISGNAFYNGAELGGLVFRSSDNGASWRKIDLPGLGAYQTVGRVFELTGGKLIIKGGQSSIYTSTLTDSAWTKVTDPGGVINVIDTYKDTIFVHTNGSGLKYSADRGTTWQLYPTNGTPLSYATATIGDMLFTPTHKFTSIGGPGNGPFRAGISDTNWVLKNSGLTSPIYPYTYATDGVKIWLSYEDIGGGCFCAASSNNGDTWTPYTDQTPKNSILPKCLRRLVPMGAHLYTYAGRAVYKMANVAQPSTVGVKTVVAEGTFDLFPNPSSGNFTLVLRDSEKVEEVNIFNLQGQLAYSSRDLSGSSVEISSGLKAGLYFLTVRGEQNSYTRKVIVH